jgi:predicted esterase
MRYAAGLVFFGCCLVAQAATLELKDGTRVRGSIVLVTDTYYILADREAGGNSQVIKTSNIKSAQLTEDERPFEKMRRPNEMQLVDYAFPLPQHSPKPRELRVTELQQWYGSALDLKADQALADKVQQAEALITTYLQSSNAPNKLIDEILGLKLDATTFHAIVRYGYVPPVTDVARGYVLTEVHLSGGNERARHVVASIPENYSPEKPWPVIIWLHGTGPGLTNAALGFPAHVREKYIIVAPWANSAHGWGPSTYGRAVLWAALDWAAAYYRIDYDRVYLEGMSMGGVGTKRNATLTPDRLAAIAPRSGPPLKQNVAALYRNLHSLPMISLAGDSDPLIPREQFTWEKSQAEALKLPATMQIFQNGAHSEYREKDDEVYAFFDKCVRSAWPERITFASYEDGPGLQHYYVEIVPDNTGNVPIVMNILDIGATRRAAGSQKDDLIKLGGDPKNIVEKKTSWQHPRELDLLVDRATNTVTIERAVRLRGLKMLIDDDLLDLDRDIVVKYENKILIKTKISRSVAFMLQEARRSGRRDRTVWASLEVPLRR